MLATVRLSCRPRIVFSPIALSSTISGFRKHVSPCVTEAWYAVRNGKKVRGSNATLRMHHNDEQAIEHCYQVLLRSSGLDASGLWRTCCHGVPFSCSMFHLPTDEGLFTTKIREQSIGRYHNAKLSAHR